MKWKIKIMKNKITHEDCDSLWFDIQEGRVNEEEWVEFCTEVHKQVLEEKKEVLKRLKNR